MGAPELRDYQLDAVQQARDHIRNGRRRVLICAPTGSGKTVIGTHLIHECVNKDRTAKFIVDRTSLINQTSKAFDKAGVDHGVIQASHWRHRPHHRAQVCSVHTLRRRKGMGPSNLNIVDEAHTLDKFTTGMLATAKDGKGEVFIGLTATPFTKGLGKHYDAIINVTTTDKLIEQGWLVPYRIFSCVEPDMHGVPVVAGEWQEAGAASAALEVVGDVVQEYLTHGEGRTFICSAVNTDHVEELVRQFQAAGINAVSYTYRDGDEERDETLEEFIKPDTTIRGLVTVSAASKGFDKPDLGCVIMARPLRNSLAEFIQLFGRGLRIAPETEKQNCLVLDHSGNCARFWDKWQYFFANGWSELDDGKKKAEPKIKPNEEAQPVKCPSCGHLHKFRPTCPNCGHVYPKATAKVEHKVGTLTELIASGNRAQLSRDLWPMICAHARARRPGDEAAAKKMALALYKDITKTWPTTDFDRTESKPITNAVYEKIRAAQIKFAYKRGAAAKHEAGRAGA